MKTRRDLNDLLAAARQAPPDQTSAEARADFARATAAQWKRPLASAAPADVWKLWQRAGIWSLGAATAVVIAVAVLRPALTPVVDNPFEVVFAQGEMTALY